MAHVRRCFERALDTDTPAAEHAISTIKSWFAVERDSKEKQLDAAARLQRRQALIAPSMKDFHQWLQQPDLGMVPQGPQEKAVAYAHRQWKGFEPFFS
jgi:hypothetical protein